MRDQGLKDVLIVGGGFAGCSAALTLYRALHTCAIFDKLPRRNAYGTLTHLTPGWEDRKPEEILAQHREELERTGLVEFVDRSAERIKKTKDGTFEVTDSGGDTWIGRKLLLANGVRNVFPDIEGYRENYARGIYYCMFCFGFEQRGQNSAGLIATGLLNHPMHAVKNAEDAQKFVDTVTIYTDGNANLGAQIGALLQEQNKDDSGGIRVDNRKIARLSRAGEEHALSPKMQIHLTDSTVRDEAFLVHKPTMVLDEKLVDGLGLEYGPSGEIKTTFPFNSTNVPGIYAAGDCASLLKQIPNAVTMGSYAGCGIARELPRHVTGHDKR